MPDFTKPQIIPHLAKNVDFTLFDCDWIPCSARFIVVGSKLDGRGSIQVYSLGPKDLQLQSESVAPKALKCSTFGATSLQERHLATGDFGGSLNVWDLENLSQPIFDVRAHEDLINAIDGIGGLEIGAGAPELATASRDGTVKVWDIRIKEKPVACIQPSNPEGKMDAWSVAFGNSFSDADRVVVSGYDNGDIKMIDLRTMGVRWETEVSLGICSLQFDRSDIEMNKLIATSLEGRIHLWDLRTFNPKSGFSRLDVVHEKATLWQGVHLPQNREVVITGGGNGELALWKYSYPDKRSAEGPDGVEGVVGNLEMIQDCHLGEQPISSISWSRDKIGLGLCTSFDQNIRTFIVTKLNTL